MRKTTLFVLFLLLNLIAFGKEGIPEKPKVAKLVNDLANILTPQQEEVLEAKLLSYFVESSTQVAVVTVKSLNGYERAHFATELAHKWGIGSSKNDNGILLLVKPKYPDSKGQVFIAVGYGLEGRATDLATGQIIRNKIIPAFKNNDYFGGINTATNDLIALTKGEYNEKQELPEEAVGFSFFVILIIMIFLIIILSKHRRSGYEVSSDGASVPMWQILDMLNRTKGKGSYGDFSSGGGIFGKRGGGFGDFGGFGGGSFGGGGAGGSW